MKKYNVLITGGLGLIGAYVAKNFANDKNIKINWELKKSI